ncbi:hypothetical protein BN12_40059 [Nostocoides japonicum T1-X7]|uniref:Uncharacterized protein n=1 Tax=Nostocoides japonicum T1-X7 TaxID=1194083 RepID=A0A077M4Q8_9MICO|nr:hypothetical protein [Tetrasphaera japonica]CCH79089.1 hypothetical protein BN12_40059 [Tetrasphaera japonica T1-X7]
MAPFDPAHPAAPYDDRSAALLSQSLTHLVTGVLILPDGTPVPIDIEGGTVTADETRAPRWEATLTCKVPADQQTLSLIDPRQPVRLVIYAGYQWPDRTQDVQHLCDLGLVGRSVNRPADTMTLHAVSDERFVMDNAASNGGTVNQSTTLAAIQYVIGQCVPAGTTITTSVTTVGGTINQTEDGQDKWNLIEDLADRINVDVYDDGTRAWFIGDRPSIGTVAAHTIQVGPTGTLTDADTDLTRDDFANRVFLRYKWTDTGGTDHTINAVKSITSGAYAAVTGNLKVYSETRDIPTTQANADAAATSLLRRTVSRGRSLSVTAISAYWLRPGHTIFITLPFGSGEAAVLASVTFDMKTGAMTLTTRLPDSSASIA